MSLRRILSWVAIAALAAAFISLCAAIPLKLNSLIPIGLFAAGIILFFVVKQMPSDIPDEEGEKTPEKSEWKRVDSESRREDGK
jgi:hypothetical protein